MTSQPARGTWGVGPGGGGVAGGTRDLRMEINSALGVVVAGALLGVVVLEGAMTVFVGWYGERGRGRDCGAIDT